VIFLECYGHLKIFEQDSFCFNFAAKSQRGLKILEKAFAPDSQEVNRVEESFSKYPDLQV